jgi:hypothetical protein
VDVQDRKARRSDVALPLSGLAIARVVSEVFSPLLVDAVLLLVIALHWAPTLATGLEWAGIAIAFVALIPQAIIVVGVRRLLALLAAMLVGLVVTLLVTLFWKISLHASTFAGAVTILVLAFGPSWALLYPLVILIGWARIELGDHRPGQVAIGAALGIVIAATVFSSLR